MAAQSSHVSPRKFDRIWAGNDGSDTSIARPAGSTGRAQYVYLAPLRPFIPASSVTGIAFRRTGNSTSYPAFIVNAKIAICSNQTAGTEQTSLAGVLIQTFTSGIPAREALSTSSGSARAMIPS